MLNKRGPGHQLIDGKPKISYQDDNKKRFPKLLEKTSHVVQYDNEKNNAAWVFEILNKETIKGPALQSPYRLDYSTQKDHRAHESLKTYKGTGFDKGHLAAAANHTWCQRARDDTNLLSNIAPQHKNVNRRKWKRLENLCRLYVQDDYSKAYIYTGPLYCIEKYITEKGIKDKDTIENEKKKIENSMKDFMSKYGKALPTHFFKVIILEKDNGEREVKCYEIPNKGLEQQQKQITQQQTRILNEVEEKEKKWEKKLRIKNQIKSIEEELITFYREIYEIETVSGLTFTEENPKILREKEKVVVVNFREDYENLMPTDKKDTIVTTVKIIPRQNVQSEE